MENNNEREEERRRWIDLFNVDELSDIFENVKEEILLDVFDLNMHLKNTDILPFIFKIELVAKYGFILNRISEIDTSAAYMHCAEIYRMFIILMTTGGGIEEEDVKEMINTSIEVYREISEKNKRNDR
jgi:hypothetical protein